MVATLSDTKPATLAAMDPQGLVGSKSARILSSIRRDMDIKKTLFDRRRRIEEVLALAYQDGTMQGGAGEVENLRTNALNLPYRYVRWLESQATSKRMVVKVSRDAGEGQRPGGPSDSKTGQWVGLALTRIAYMGGFEREIKALIGEVCARGTSVMKVGYHEEAIDLQTSREVGKDAQSIVPEVLTATTALAGGEEVSSDAFEAKPGQAHEEISAGLAAVAGDPMVQMAAGRDGVMGLLQRKASHDQAAMEQESDAETPISSTRLIRHRIYLRKLRVGEDVGWAPHVYDSEDAPWWWERLVYTVAEVKRSTLFTDAFKAVVKGYDARNVSGVASGGQTPSTVSMGSDARQAQSEDVLDEDERLVEVFLVWFRRPDMLSGGIRKIVASEFPEAFVETDDSNPHVDDAGRPLIEGFYPYFDFTPILSTLTTPERTTGIPPLAVGMPQFEQIAEANRLVHESALRHSLRLYDVDPAHATNKALLNAIKNGEDGHANIMKAEQVGTDGKARPSVTPIQFTGNTQEIERYAAMAETQWVKVMGMPPAVLQGVGTAETATQDAQGIAAGERESMALVGYHESRVADVLGAVRGFMRGNYDDEDFQNLLGAEGAAVLKEWQTGTADDGDRIEVTFGARALAQETVEKKQLMEAITLVRASVDPVTGLPKYDEHPLVEELFRRLDVGAPQVNASNIKTLEDAVIKMAAIIQQLTGVNPLGGATSTGNGGPGGPKPTAGKDKSGGPNASEGDGPSQGNLSAGAVRGTVGAQNNAPQGAATQTY